MLEVTDTAAAVLTENLAARRQRDHDIFRVSRAGGDLSLALGEMQDGDVVIQHQKRPILVLEPGVVDELGDVIIDTAPSMASTLIIKPAGYEYA